MTRSLIIGATFAASLALPTFASEYTLRLAHGDTEANPTHQTAVRFQELAAEYSDERITVEIFPNNQLGDEQEVAQSVARGTIESQILFTGNLQPMAPSVGVMMLPYAFTDVEESWEIMDALVDPLNERVTEEARVRVLGYLEKGYRVLTNSVRPVETLEDLQGLRIRVSPVDITIRTFQAWGLDPIPMAWDEVFTALQQGVIDGQENPYTTAVTSNFYEVQDYITEIRYMMWNGPLIVSEQVFQSMPEDLQEALERAGREAVQYGREVARQDTEDAKERLRELGMTLSGPPQDEERWQEAALALWPEFYDVVGGEAWVNEVNEIRESIMNR